MKKYMTYLLLGFLIMVLITFIMGLGDDAYLKNYHSGIWYRDVINSLKYYVPWVLPYWWLLILIGTISLAALFYIGKVGIEKLSS